MKKFYLLTKTLLVMALLCVGANAWAAYTDYLTEDNGWTQVTATSGITTDGSAVYVIVASEFDLVVGIPGENSNAQLTYQTISGQPLRQQVWYFEADTYDGGGYALKNLARTGYYITAVSGDTGAWNLVSRASEKNTAYTCYQFSFDNGYFYIQTNSAVYSDNPDRYWGDWTVGTHVNGSTLAGNKIQANRTKFKLFKRILNTPDQDVTFFIGNPSFEDELTKGWTNTGGMVRQGNNFFGKTGSYYAEAFEPKDTKRVSQTISGLPAGNYTLSAHCIARGVTSAKIYAGSIITEITISESQNDYEVKFVCENNNASVDIGFEGVGTAVSKSWLAVDNFQLTYESTDVGNNKRKIKENKGDITSLINGTFDADADGWDGGSRVATVKDRGWRGGNATIFYERTTAGTMSYTLSNMPAGTYKVVAAWRSINGGTMTPSIAGTNGSTVTGTGDAAPAVGTKEINMNGVEMPYSNLGGFTTNNLGHNWHWITATGTLAEDGNLVINFTTAGTAGWNAIDDVHLYCTSLGGTSYTTTVTEGSAVSNSDGKVVTCDIILSNPNSIVSSDEIITTAAGAHMYNNLVSGKIEQMMLYDGYTFSMSAGDYTINNSYGAAKFYRSLTENTYCTICLPFTPAAGSGTYYEPTTLSDGSLTISEVADEDLKPNTPYILKPSGNYNDIWNNNNAGNSEKYNVKYTNNQPATEVDGGKMWFTGRLEKQNVLGSWDGNYYVLGTDNELHKISYEGSVAVNPFRAYFYVAGSPSARTISISLGDKVTGVENVEAASEAKAKDGKFVEGNQLYIYKKGVKFNAAGQQVK